MKHLRKLSSILALLCLAVAGTWAQSTTRTPFKAPGENQVTVCDGTTSNQYVPFEGYNADGTQHNQMIFPATDLTALSGKLITQITFYIDTDASNGSYTAADRLGTWTVSLGETEATTLSALDDSTPLTPVYQGYFDCSTGTLTLLLDGEYVYQGGNLLVDLNHPASSYNKWYFLGVEATGASFTRNAQRNFLPKTTFSYAEAPACPKPSGFSVADITQTAATLSWTEKGTATAWQICLNGDETNLIDANSNPFTLTGLTPVTAYTASVRAVSGSNYSYWTAAANFKTQPLRTLGDIPAGWTVLADGQPVTVTDGVAQFFDGAKIKLVPPTAYAAKVKSVTTKDEPYSVPLTLEALTAGTVRVNSPKAGMQYTLNNGAKTAMSGTTTIDVAAGDKVAFYGNGTAINIYQGTSIYGGSAEVKVYGNIMSLVDEDDFATATTLTSTYTFRSFFNNNNKLKDASGLLLPATELAPSCYSFMFMGCNALTAAPELPATTMASGCYSFMFADCSNLTAAPALPAETLAENCYNGMFNGCTALTTAPALPATELAIGCYGNMFYGCSGLTSAPTLPAETLAESCYSSMFSGCSNLTAAPALPATTMAGYCYNGMFQSCTSLTAAPALPAETLAPNCYSSMFQSCTSLTTAPVLPATTMAGYCYNGMFQGCTALTTAPALPATELANGCYYKMFTDCSNLTAAPALPAETMAEECYSYMFSGCSNLTAAPALTATTMANRCYSYMFSGCTSLTAAPALPAETLAESCYSYMFSGCSNLTAAPALPATQLASGCYQYMFQGCTALTAAPALPAETLASNCYNNMFNGCTALTTAPALPATTMAGYCYNGMFNGCTALTTAPALPAKTLASNCYQNMFKGCSALTTAPALPATTMVYSCYSSMFENCTALTASPVLPATQLANGCYGAMFRGCSNLGTVTALAASSSGNTNNWLYNAGTNVTGTKYFITPSTSNWLTNSASGIPSGWTRQNYVE